MNKTEADIKEAKYPFWDSESRLFVWFSEEEYGEIPLSLPLWLFLRIGGVKDAEEIGFVSETDAYQAVFETLDEL